MSRLETRVEPMFEVMFRGGKAVFAFDGPDQEILSIWAFKSALATAATIPRGSLKPPSRHYLDAAKGRLSDGVHVFATHVSGSTSFSLTVHGMWMLANNNELVEANGSYMALLHYGNIVFIVAYWSDPNSALGIPEGLLFPIGRGFEDYSWYQLQEPELKSFESVDDLIFSISRSIIILRSKEQPGTTLEIHGRQGVFKQTPIGRVTSVPMALPVTIRH